MSEVQINLRVKPELLERIEAARGSRARNPFLVGLIEQVLPLSDAMLERELAAAGKKIAVLTNELPPLKESRAALAKHHPHCDCRVCRGRAHASETVAGVEGGLSEH